MKGIRRSFAVLASVGLVLAIAAPASAQQLKSTEDVKTALRLLVQVSNDFKRQITNKNFARVPKEYTEYTEAAGVGRDFARDTPAGFQEEVAEPEEAAGAALEESAELKSEEAKREQ